ncbi:hypothetical protein BDW74DRAFT_168621 [Aspergillus multicolor]|uniref:uncharacterized protein n=1 Tax=Aspergillus multicolor TaxID=41759 RepID=UPI003CCD972E
MATYFELSWSILSSIGLFVTLVGIWALFISRPSPLTYIPIVVSVSCAIANGACYYAFYATEHAIPNRAVASGFADFFWLIQEAGLSFYSYQILVHTLRNKARVIFLCIFWFFLVAIASFRITILVYRILDIASGANTIHSGGPYQHQIGYLHVGYFTTIALVETWSSIFLIRLLHNAYQVSPKVSSTRFIFRYLLRTTEIRVASLCFIGITRAVTYSSQVTSQSATTVAGQVDRFAYTMECLFPLVMLIDTLASKKLNQDTQLESFSTFSPSASPVRYRNINTYTEPLPPIRRHSRWLSSWRG